MLDSDFVAPGANTKDIAFPRFYMKLKKNEFRSAATGKPEYDKKDYVEITTPGDTRCIIDREVQEKDKARWPSHWIAYQNGQELTVDGTPLEKWPQIDIAQIEELKHFRIRSVEQLSKVSDTALGNLPMGARSLREKAIVWLEEARNGSGISKLIAEKEALKAQLEAMQDQIRELANRPAPAAASNVLVEGSQPDGMQMAISPEAIQDMIAKGIAAAMANAPAPAKNKGGRPPKAKPDAEAPPTE